MEYNHSYEIPTENELELIEFWDNLANWDDE